MSAPGRDREDKEPQTFEEWVAAKDAELAERQRTAVAAKDAARSAKVASSREAQTAFKAFLVRSSVYDKAVALLPALVSDAENDLTWRGVAKALAFVHLALLEAHHAASAAADAAGGVGGPLHSAAAINMPSVFKAFRRWSRAHHSIAALPIREELLPRFTANSVAIMEVMQLGADGASQPKRYEATALRFVPPPPGATAGVPAPDAAPSPANDDALRNWLFDGVVRSAWDAALADASAALLAGVSSAAGDDGGGTRSRAGSTASTAEAEMLWRLQAAAASDAGKALCARRGLRWLQQRAEQVARDKETREREEKCVGGDCCCNCCLRCCHSIAAVLPFIDASTPIPFAWFPCFSCIYHLQGPCALRRQKAARQLGQGERRPAHPAADR